MLIRLMPEQVAEWWPRIVSLIRNYVGHLDEHHMAQVLQSIYAGVMQCWFCYDSHGETEGDPCLIVLTALRFDLACDLRELEIYVLVGISPMSDSLWVDGLKTLKKFADSEKCWRVIGHTDNARIIKLVDGVLGGESNERVVSMEISDEDIL